MGILGVRALMGGYTWCQGYNGLHSDCQSSYGLTNGYRYDQAWYYLLTLCGAVYAL